MDVGLNGLEWDSNEINWDRMERDWISFRWAEEVRRPWRLNGHIRAVTDFGMA